MTSEEILALLKAVKDNRHGLRDELIILMAYKHALRVSELVELKWDQVDFKNAILHVNRLKNGDDSVQRLSADESRMLRELRKQTDGAFLFFSERRENMQRFVAVMFREANKLKSLKKLPRLQLMFNLM